MPCGQLTHSWETMLPEMISSAIGNRGGNGRQRNRKGLGTMKNATLDLKSIGLLPCKKKKQRHSDPMKSKMQQVEDRNTLSVPHQKSRVRWMRCS